MGKLDLELEVLKCKIHEEDILDDFKENLEKRLNEKYESYVPKHKSTRTFKIYNYIGRAVAACACFMVLSTCAFADEIEGMFNLLFANTNQNIETAYEEGNIKEIDSEYQTYDGVSLKVDYVLVNENNLNIAFNIKTEEEFKKIAIDEFCISDKNSQIIYDTNDVFLGVENVHKVKRIDKYNNIMIESFVKEDSTFKNYKVLDFVINSISVIKENQEEAKKISGNWRFEINL